VLVNLTVENGRVKIGEVLFKGKEVNGRLSGSIILKKPVEKSVFKLSGEMKSPPEFLSELDNRMPIQLLSKRNRDGTKIKFKIEGTVEKPVFSF
jgi:hypothetical protein